MRVPTLAAALLLSTLGPSAWAQSPAEHNAHHSDQKDAPAAAQPAPPATQPGMGGMGGAQGSGMMGGGMMGGGMMGMMGKMPMMQTAGMTRECGDGMSGMETIDRVEGRIAFLRTELKITDAQTSAWNGFADALRANAKALGELRTSMMTTQPGAAPQTLADRLSLQEKWLAARLDGTRAIKTALVALAATFSDDQKKAADDLLAPHMGMMSGMRGGMMGMGRPQSGR
jgi:hypothetical protein